MKREGLRHPKMLDLMSRLAINRREAVGLLDLLLDWAIDYAPCGDIGKWTNGVIAGAVEWHGSADDLVNALVASGWLDEHEKYRLVIHDWPDHAPTFVRAKLKKLGLAFLECYESSENNTEDSLEPSREGNIPPLSSPLLPSGQTPSNQTPAGAAPPGQKRLAAAAVEEISEPEWRQARPIAQQIKTLIRPTGRLGTDERDWAAKIAVLALRRGAQWLEVAVEGVKHAKPKEPKAYMHTLLDGECERAGTRLNRELARIKIPESFTTPKVLA